MEKQVLSKVNATVSLEGLMKALRMPEDTYPEDLNTLRGMLEEASALANPKGIYGAAPITEKGTDYVAADGVIIRSALVRRNLDKVHRIVPFIATCGVELEEWSHRFTDPLEGYWADGIKLQFLAAVRSRLHEAIRSAYFLAGDMSMMNPGSLPGWPLTEQAVLFRLIGDVTETIGVRLTDSYLMLPSKSTSGFFFSAETHYENCQYCPLENCPNRRAARMRPER